MLLFTNSIWDPRGSNDVHNTRVSSALITCAACMQDVYTMDVAALNKRLEARAKAFITLEEKQLATRPQVCARAYMRLNNYHMWLSVWTSHTTDATWRTLGHVCSFPCLV